MAKLSSNLVQGLMNPSYAGRLSDSIVGGVADIQAGVQQKKARHAKESMTQMMLNGDMNDPAMQNSMTAVASQMGQDPEMATDMIEAGKASQAREEDQKMQKATFEQNKSKHDYVMNKNKEADALKKATEISVARVNKNPENMETIIASLPVDQQAPVRAAVVERMQFDTAVATYKEKAKGKEPFEEDILKSMAETEGMGPVIQVYEDMVGQYPEGAKRLLLSQYESVRNNEMITQRSVATKNRPLTTTEIKGANAYVEEMFKNKLTIKQWASNMLPGKDEHQDPQVLKAAVAKRLAYLSRDKTYDPTPEAVQAIYQEVLKEQQSLLPPPPPGDGPVAGAPALGDPMDPNAPSVPQPKLKEGGRIGTMNGRPAAEGADGNYYYTDDGTLAE